MTTHSELVSRAVHWLRHSQRCAVVVHQVCVMLPEQPDAIGWNCSGNSTLLECKATRADFKRDRDKPHRLLAGLGNRRFYFTPPGLLRREELPDGWGLLEVHASLVRTIVGARTRLHDAKDSHGEIKHLVNLMREIWQPVPPVGAVRPENLFDVGL
jgi:hypothetical protein